MIKGCKAKIQHPGRSLRKLSRPRLSKKDTVIFFGMNVPIGWRIEFTMYGIFCVGVVKELKQSFPPLFPLFIPSKIRRSAFLTRINNRPAQAAHARE